MVELKRTISFSTTVAIVIGGVIGSGIFKMPAAMAGQVSSPLLLLSVWVVAGLVTLFGALSNAEVACMFPKTGGQFVFFQKMYGDFFSFLYGWAAFTVFNTAGNASIAYVCAEYGNYFLQLPRLDAVTEQSYYLSLPGIGKLYLLQNLGVKLLTVALVVVFSYINYKSVQYGGGVQRVLTALKIAAIAVLIFGLLGSGNGSLHNLTAASSGVPAGIGLLGAYMAAIAGAFWAYDGWNNITFIAGEIKSPQRNIPKSLLSGLLVCMITYVLFNIGLLYVLPVDKMAQSTFVASDAATIAWGTSGAVIITIMIIVSTLGSTNSNVLATARVTAAWSSETRLFNAASKVHPGNLTPANALALNGAWSCILIISGSFEMLTNMLVFVSWFFYMMSGIGLFVLRSKYRDTDRPYRVPGYPLVPIIFVLFAAAFLAVTLYTDISDYHYGKSNFINSAFGLVITAAGIPLYFLSKKRKVTAPGVTVSTGTPKT